MTLKNSNSIDFTMNYIRIEPSIQRKILLSLIMLLYAISIHCQEDEGNKKISLNGYVSNMQTIFFEDVSDEWVNDNMVHNRVNFYWYLNDYLTFNTEVRTRIFTGESVKYREYSSAMFDFEKSYFDMSHNIVDEQSILVNSMIDRIWLSFEKNKWDITVGRQRINWGQTYVWNPNDIFNTYSFFDFDYIEKPGSDAVRIQYYPNWSSTFELAGKIDINKKFTFAGLYRFNKFGYDIQFISGILAEEDYFAGAGWSGNIKNVGFKGEVSYFHPKENMGDTTGLIISSASVEYSFANSLMLQGEVLFSNVSEPEEDSFIDYYSTDLNVKTIAFSEVSLFTQASYPVTPLINVTLSGMLFPKLKGFFIGPGFDFSLSDNATFSLLSQSFSMKIKESDRQNFHYLFLRLKYNF